MDVGIRYVSRLLSFSNRQIIHKIQTYQKRCLTSPNLVDERFM